MSLGAVSESHGYLPKGIFFFFFASLISNTSKISFLRVALCLSILKGTVKSLIPFSPHHSIPRSDTWWPPFSRLPFASLSSWVQIRGHCFLFPTQRFWFLLSSWQVHRPPQLWDCHGLIITFTYAFRSRISNSATSFNTLQAFQSPSFSPKNVSFHSFMVNKTDSHSVSPDQYQWDTAMVLTQAVMFS